MAYIGMRYPVAAPITAHTDGSAITYGNGFVVGNAVQANINFDVNDNPDWGDDIIIDNDTGINGYNGTLDVNALSASVRASLLGWTAVGSATTHYEVTDASAPDVGFGFIHISQYKGTKSYETYWFHSAQFSQQSIAASTKERQITWNHPQMNFVGKGVYLDSSGKAKYFDWMSFDSESSAKSWLNSKAGISG
jgi:phi13 family phage major tail protein